jgi:predicted transcriptional regulator
MATTSLKLADELKKRAASAAQAQGVSPHAFMVNAIELAATATEQRARFVADALAAKAKMLATGKGYAADEVHSYLKARASGEQSAKPLAKTWRH